MQGFYYPGGIVVHLVAWMLFGLAHLGKQWLCKWSCWHFGRLITAICDPFYVNRESFADMSTWHWYIRLRLRNKVQRSPDDVSFNENIWIMIQSTFEYVYKL